MAQLNKNMPPDASVKFQVLLWNNVNKYII